MSWRRTNEHDGRGGAGSGELETAELEAFEREYTVERVSQRDLMIDLGAVLWMMTLFAVLAAGQLTEKPDTPLEAASRIVMAIVCVVAAIALLTVVKRFNDQVTLRLVASMAVVGLLMQYALSFYGPGALGGFYVALYAVTIYCAQFLGPRGLTAIMALITVLAGLSVRENYLADYAPHLLSQTVLLVIVLWGVAFSIQVLKRDRERAIEESELTAFSDVLTGLPNFRMLRRRADVLLDPRNRRINGRTGIVLVDLDEFRAINMLRGNREGDRVLRTVAAALAAAAPSGHLVARTGSDEFTVLIPNTSTKQMTEMAVLYRSAVARATSMAGGPMTDISASFGTAISDQSMSLDDMMLEADRLLYLEKAAHEHQPEPRHQTNVEDGRSDPAWHSDMEPRAATPGRWSHLSWSRRSIQTRFLTLAWPTAGVAILISMHMPDAADPNMAVLHGIVVFTCLVGAARYVMAPPKSFAVQLADVLLGSLALAVVIHFFGGSSSPAVPIVLFILIYIGWFMPLRAVVPVSIAALVTMLIPTMVGPQTEMSAMDAVTVFGGIAVTSTLLVVLYYNHYYIDRAKSLTRQLAWIDPRTGSYNRRAFEARMAEEIERLSFGDREALAVVMVDMGSSKNLGAGHARKIRDELLTGTARALAATSRDQDLVARLGGDEFIVAAPGVDAESARALTQRLVGAVRETIAKSESPLVAEALPSAGFALYGMHGRTTEELLAAADIALTTAKTSGRDPQRVSSFVVSL